MTGKTRGSVAARGSRRFRACSGGRPKRLCGQGISCGSCDSRQEGRRFAAGCSAAIPGRRRTAVRPRRG
ncbi:hypothetical protein FCJ57_35960 [Burkholderia diffusa]|nr:hypothetical protein [Burkholderia diffusa]